MYPNPLKQKLTRGQLVLGTVLPAPDLWVLATILDVQEVQPDFLWIDTEHAPFSTEALGAIPVLARQRGVAPLVRVAWNDPALIKKAYDTGAVAVMVPQIDTPEEAEQAVQYARYAPQGRRGVSPMWPRIAGEDTSQVIRTANEETVLVLQIESQRAYENIDTIKKVPGVDVLFVGPTDLSASLGKIGETRDTEVQDILRDVPQRLKDTSIVPATLVGNTAEAQEKILWGYRFVSVGNPLDYGAQALKQNLELIRDNPTGK